MITSVFTEVGDHRKALSIALIAGMDAFRVVVEVEHSASVSDVHADVMSGAAFAT